jgi:thiol:disulfide interchange protein
MAREVYTDKEFIQFSRKHVFMRVMTDTDAEGALLSRRFGIEGTPTLIIINSSGREVDRIVGFRDAWDLIDEIQEITENAPAGRYTL